MPVSDEYRHKILKILQADPAISQRELAKQLGMSVGKVNYCLKAFVQVGLVKARNFKNHANKRAYIYALTPKGLEEKAAVSARFLRLKLKEYEALQAEIEMLRREVDGAEGEI